MKSWPGCTGWGEEPAEKKRAAFRRRSRIKKEGELEGDSIKAEQRVLLAALSVLARGAGGVGIPSPPGRGPRVLGLRALTTIATCDGNLSGWKRD